MTPHPHLQTRTATAVSRERAAANQLPTLDQPYDIAPTPFHPPIDAPTRRRVERIAGRFAPRPPQATRETVSTSQRSRKSLTLMREIKTQTANLPRP